MIKVGDKVRRKNYDHGTFDIGDVGTVSEVLGPENVRLLGDRTRFPDYSHRIENLELVASARENSVVRTRTITEIVDGVYGIIHVDTHRDQVVITISAEDGWNPSAAKLTDAIVTLTAIRDALEENAK